MGSKGPQPLNMAPAKGLIQEDKTSDPRASPRDWPEQPLLQRQSHTMPELGRGWQLECGRV